MASDPEETMTVRRGAGAFGGAWRRWPVRWAAYLAGAALLAFGAMACFSGAFGRLLQRSARGQRWLNRLTALVFVGLALRLASLQR